MAYYGITSKGQLIDKDTINAGCKKIDEAAKKFLDSANFVSKASEICDANALSVENTTMQAQLDLDAQYLKSMNDKVKEFTQKISEIAEQVYEQQSIELENYQAEQKDN